MLRHTRESFTVNPTMLVQFRHSPGLSTRLHSLDLRRSTVDARSPQLLLGAPRVATVMNYNAWAVVTNYNAWAGLWLSSSFGSSATIYR